MVYCTIEEWAIHQNYDSFDGAGNTYKDENEHPIQVKLEKDIEYTSALINEYIKPDEDTAIDIVDTRYTRYLKQLCMEMLDRRYDKQVDRTASEGRGIYNPHNYLYQLERDKLERISLILGYVVFGGLRT